MRELKFRAWDDKDKKWLLGYDYENLGGFSMMGEVMAFGQYTKMLNSFKLKDWDCIKLMQFTGLLDKNNKEIYEADICRLFSCDRPIVFKDGSFGYMTDFNELAWFVPIGSNSHFNWEDGRSDKIEVIGNIYQNPELLTP